MLVPLGLSVAAERLYYQMLENPGETAEYKQRDDESRLGSASRAERELREKGLLTNGVRGPLVIPEQHAIAILLGRQEMELSATRRRVEKARAYAASIERSLDSATRIETVIGLEAVFERFRELSRHAKFEVCSFVPHVKTEQLEKSRDLNEEMFTSGIKSRTVYLSSIRNNPEMIERAAWITKMGSDVRTVPALPLRMIVIDRELAIVPTDPENPAVGVDIISSAGAVAGLLALFEAVWNQAVPMSTRVASDEKGLTSEERVILEMLASGFSHESIARRVGVATKTVSRTVARMMERLGAKSPFQVGYLAAKRGWL